MNEFCVATRWVSEALPIATKWVSEAWPLVGFMRLGH